MHPVLALGHPKVPHHLLLYCKPVGVFFVFFRARYMTPRSPLFLAHDNAYAYAFHGLETIGVMLASVAIDNLMREG